MRQAWGNRLIWLVVSEEQVGGTDKTVSDWVRVGGTVMRDCWNRCCIWGISRWNWQYMLWLGKSGWDSFEGVWPVEQGLYPRNKWVGLLRQYLTGYEWVGQLWGVGPLEQGVVSDDQVDGTDKTWSDFGTSGWDSYETVGSLEQRLYPRNKWMGLISIRKRFFRLRGFDPWSLVSWNFY